MRPLTRRIGLGAGFPIVHFLATWFVTLQAWQHDWAARLEKILWFPANLTNLGGGKFSNLVLMIGNSALWGVLFFGLIMLGSGWIGGRKRTEL